MAVVQRLEGSLVFDCDVNSLGRHAPNSRPPRAPRWLQDALGPEFFRTIYTVWVRRKVPDSELTFLQGLTELRTLHLAGTDVSDAGLSFLSSMPHLWGLDLMRCPLIGDGSAREIGGLAELKELYLSGTRITDVGLACLRGKDRLRILFLSDLPVTDAGLANLEGLTGLTAVDLNGTQVTDAGLAVLKRMSALEQLGLSQDTRDRRRTDPARWENEPVRFEFGRDEGDRRGPDPHEWADRPAASALERHAVDRCRSGPTERFDWPQDALARSNESDSGGCFRTPEGIAKHQNILGTLKGVKYERNGQPAR